MWHSHNFFLPYFTVEECFTISITFIFNLYFLHFVVDKLPAFIVTVNIFKLDFCILPECSCIHLIPTIKGFILYPRLNCGEWNKYLWQLIKRLKHVYLWGGLPLPSTPVLILYLHESRILFRDFVNKDVTTPTSFWGLVTTQVTVSARASMTQMFKRRTFAI